MSIVKGANFIYMEATYNLDTTDSSLNFEEIYKMYLGVEFLRGGDFYQNHKHNTAKEFREEYLKVFRSVHLPRLSTIETYDELIKYVEEMYVNGMILGDEFVMKPTDEQSDKLINSTYTSLYGDIKIGDRKS